MGRGLIVATLAVVGLLCAAGMGYAAYVVSRGSVAVPVTRLEQAPQDLTPSRVRAKAKPKPARHVDDHDDANRRAASPASADHDRRRPRRCRGGGGGHGGDD